MDNLNFGWEEWVSLPGLGMPALKAKIDTGARTSALHAHNIEVFGPASKPKVRFNVHPIPGKDTVDITCSAPILDRREVTSSNGESELRYVIETTLDVGGQQWPILHECADAAGAAGACGSHHDHRLRKTAATRTQL
jgi:ribosomal protein S6--L-glutamate ligase